MGYYVNPKDGQTKEDWLSRNGEVCEKLADLKMEEDRFPVILVDNGAFTAAGIAYCQRELEEFTDKGDPRPRVGFMVPKDLLEEFMKR